MLKKIILILGLLLCAILIVSLSFNDEDKRVHISFASWGSESEVRILKPILNNFEKENPDIKVDFMHIPQNYFQKIHLLFASNTAPDVIFINNQYLPLYANAGMLEDLSGYEFDFDNFYKNSISSMSWKGGIYAIPRDISNLVIFYNKDLFKKYSVPYPRDNWTYSQFLSAAKKLTRDGVFGVSFEENPLYFLPYIVMYDGWTNDDTLNFFNEDILSKPNIKKALETYAQQRYKYHIAPLKQELGSMTSGQMFLQGRLGMYFSGRWMVPKLRQDAGFDWDVVQFPTLTGGEKSFVLTDSSGWALSKFSKHKQESVLLIKYLSSPKISEEFTKSGLIVPAREDVANSKAFNDGQKPLNYRAFLDAAKNSRPTPVTVDYNEILDTLKNKTERIFNK